MNDSESAFYFFTVHVFRYRFFQSEMSFPITRFSRISFIFIRLDWSEWTSKVIGMLLKYFSFWHIQSWGLFLCWWYSSTSTILLKFSDLGFITMSGRSVPPFFESWILSSTDSSLKCLDKKSDTFFCFANRTFSVFQGRRNNKVLVCQWLLEDDMNYMLLLRKIVHLNWNEIHSELEHNSLV